MTTTYAPSRNEAIAEIKRALRERSGKTWSVTGGRGTAWGWITISAPPSRRGCAEQHRFATAETCGDCGADRQFVADYSCSAHVCDSRCYGGYIVPAERVELAALLGLAHVHPQGVNIAAGSDYRAEYVARARGEAPTVRGQQYWD